MRGVSAAIRRRSSGVSIVGSPVEPMKSSAAVPWSSGKRRSVRNAPKSTEPAALNGVTSATNEPSSGILAMDPSPEVSGRRVRVSPAHREYTPLSPVEAVPLAHQREVLRLRHRAARRDELLVALALAAGDEPARVLAHEGAEPRGGGRARPFHPPRAAP